MECWCDKTGGKLIHTGTCSDAVINVPLPPYKQKRKVRTKRERDIKHKAKLRRMYKDLGDLYPCPVCPVDKHGNYTEDKDDIAYYKRQYIGGGKNGITDICKKRSNRIVRRYHGKIPKGNSYKKLYDYWWEII